MYLNSQDFLTSSYLITAKDTFYTREQFGQLMAYMGDGLDAVVLPPPAIIMPQVAKSFQHINRSVCSALRYPPLIATSDPGSKVRPPKSVACRSCGPASSFSRCLCAPTQTHGRSFVSQLIHELVQIRLGCAWRATVLCLPQRDAEPGDGGEAHPCAGARGNVPERRLRGVPQQRPSVRPPGQGHAWRRQSGWPVPRERPALLSVGTATCLLSHRLHFFADNRFGICRVPLTRSTLHFLVALSADLCVAHRRRCC